MPPVKQNPAHSVYVPVLDGEHKEMVAAIDALRQAATVNSKAALAALQKLIDVSADHFAHEERMMQHTRYHLYEWHKRQHDQSKKRLKEFAAALESGDAPSAIAAAERMEKFLMEHTGVHDRMLAAHLRSYAWEPYHSASQASGGVRISSASGFLATRLSAAKMAPDRNPWRTRPR